MEVKADYKTRPAYR